jgi:signal peptidase I
MSWRSASQANALGLRNPLHRLTERLPRPVQIAVDWAVTIAVALAIVLAIKAWVVNPYRIPTSSMEPTLHCARPKAGCQARFSDRVLANRFVYHFKNPERGDIVVFETPEVARVQCREGGTFVKRIVGLPGERIVVGEDGFVTVNGARLDETDYLEADRRGGRTVALTVPDGRYFMLGDNRQSSCDSRVWGALEEDRIIGEVFALYWPPGRLGFAAVFVGTSLLTLGLRAGRRPSSL